MNHFMVMENLGEAISDTRLSEKRGDRETSEGTFGLLNIESDLQVI